MHLNIQGRHVSITPALNNYIKGKLEKIKYYFDNIINIHVVLEVLKEDQIVEVNITAQHHHFHNKVKNVDMYKSIDFVFDKMESQVCRYKEFLIDQKNRNSRSIAKIEIADSQDVLEREKVSIDLKEWPPVDKPMSILEAIVQLKALDNVFILAFYQNVDSLRLSYILPEKTPDTFSLICFDHVWERHQLRLIDKNRFEAVVIESLRPSTEMIEDAVNYLMNHFECPYRFYISGRTHESALLFHAKGKSFQLIRETS